MNPATVDAHGVATLLLTVVALYLFTRDRIPLESSSLGILIVLCAGFTLFPYERGDIEVRATDFFDGFGNEALIAICALMMVGKGLETTGSLQPLANIVSKAWSKRIRHQSSNLSPSGSPPSDFTMAWAGLSSKIGVWPGTF